MNIIRGARLNLCSPIETKWKINEALYEDLSNTKNQTDFVEGTDGVNCLAIDEVQQRFMIAGGTDSSLEMWDLKPGNEYSEDNENTKNTENDENIENGEKNSRKPRKVMRVAPRVEHTSGISSVNWWPFDDGLIVTSSFDGTVKVWDSSSMDLDGAQYSFDLGSIVYNIDISKESTSPLVATALNHPLIRLLDLRTTATTHTLSSRSTSSGGSGYVSKSLSVKWSPTDPNILASGGSDGSLKLWDIRRSNACLMAFDIQQSTDTPNNAPTEFRKAHRSAVNGIKWFPSGDYIVSAGNDERIRLWSLYPTGGKNMLVNFGPLIRNKNIQTKDPCLSPQGDLPFPYMLFPSDTGELFIFRCMDGKMVKRLSPMNRENSKPIKRATCAISFEENSLQYFTGHTQGGIVHWSPGDDADSMSDDDDDNDDIYNSAGVASPVRVFGDTA